MLINLLKNYTMLSLSDYINKNNNLFLNTFGSIRFELDESSMDFLSDDVKKFINEYDSNEEYKISLQDGTSSSESVKAPVTHINLSLFKSVRPSRYIYSFSYHHPNSPNVYFLKK